MTDPTVKPKHALDTAAARDLALLGLAYAKVRNKVHENRRAEIFAPRHAADES